MINMGKKKKNSSSSSSISSLALFVIISIALIVHIIIAFSMGFVEAGRSSGSGNKKSHHEIKRHSHRSSSTTHHEYHDQHSKTHNYDYYDYSNFNAPVPGADPLLPAPAPASSSFNILSYGAKGDGVSDDSKALTAVWKAACSSSSQLEKVPVPGETTTTTTHVVVIPSDSIFLIKPALTLQGPCTPHHLLLQLDGTLVLLPPPPPYKQSSPKSTNFFHWINFKWLHNFTIQGPGTIDGQGSNWWYWNININSTYSFKHPPPVPFHHHHHMNPTALRFYASYNVTVRDIKIVNSPQCHLKFDNSDGVMIDNITISAPENSPNTDGIHLQNTHHVQIQHSNIGCGDDCVSIQTGCSNIHVHNINCGPGHGISLGGLGKDKSRACVSNIMVENIFMQNTLYGARIKTWQGGIGLVKNVTFSNINVWNVKVPVQIDQYYCDKKSLILCKNQTAAVAISGVKFERVIGTYSVQPFHIACSQEIPCVDVSLIEIQLEPSSSNYSSGFQQGLCWNSYGRTEGALLPSSIKYCLTRANSLINKIIARSKHDHTICN